MTGRRTFRDPANHCLLLLRVRDHRPILCLVPSPNLCRSASKASFLQENVSYLQWLFLCCWLRTDTLIKVFRNVTNTDILLSSRAPPFSGMSFLNYLLLWAQQRPVFDTNCLKKIHIGKEEQSSGYVVGCYSILRVSVMCYVSAMRPGGIKWPKQSTNCLKVEIAFLQKARYARFIKRRYTCWGCSVVSDRAFQTTKILSK